MSETMRREILGQPQLLSDILPGLRQGSADLPRLEGATVWAGGCGDCAFAAAAMAGWFRSCGLPYRSATAHDLAFHSPVAANDIVVLMSISGGTRRTVQAARRVKQAGASTVAITCNPDSALANACDHVVPLGFQPLSRRTPHTADYLATLLALAVLGDHWGGPSGDGLPGVARAVEQTLATGTETAMMFGADLTGKLFVLGQGGNWATADYIAAKYHESGGLFALAAETENFVHGMNFMVEPNDSVLILGGDGEGAHRADELAGAMGRLCRSVALARADGAANRPGQAVLLPGMAVEPGLSPFVLAVIGQLVCLGTVTQRAIDVETIRAGRGDAATHGAVQADWMSGTRVD